MVTVRTPCARGPATGHLRDAGPGCVSRCAEMERIPSPKDLRAAAAAAQTLTYVTGVAGVVAGAILYGNGETAFAIVAWVLTFAAGAILMIASFLARGMAALLARIARIEQDIATFVSRDRPEDRAPGRDRDPWQGGHTPPY